MSLLRKEAWTLFPLAEGSVCDFAALHHFDQKKKKCSHTGHMVGSHRAE